MHRLLQRFCTVLTTGCLLFLAGESNAQVTILTPDTTICNGVNTTLRAVSGTGVPTSTALTTDDVFSAAINIGFPFTFYGNTYTQCVVSSNGNISFDLTKAGKWASYDPNAGGAIPGNANVLNTIMGNWMDLDPNVPGSGSIDYAYTGTAPNRRFLVNYCDIPFFGTTQGCNVYRSSFQIILNEGSNNIEMYIRTKPICTGWPNTIGGTAVQGLQNANGTVAHLTPGRGYPTVPWTATNDGRLFSPTSATNYTISTVPFAPIPTTGASTINWYTAGNVAVGTGNTVIVSPTANTTYYARQIYCSDTTTDSVRVTLGGNPNIDSIQMHNPSYCGNNDGSIIIFGLETGSTYHIDYNKNGVPQAQLTAVATPAGTLSIENLTAGIYDNIGVSTLICLPGSRRGPFALIDPRIPVDFTFLPKYGCHGVDSVSYNNITPIPGTIAYTWHFGDGSVDTVKHPTHGYAGQNTYLVKLIADNGTCRDSISKIIDTRHPLHAFFLSDIPSACQAQTINFRDSSVTTVIGGVTPQYFWDFGDGTTGTGDKISHAYTATGTYTVRLVVQDFVPCTDTFTRTITINTPPVVTFTNNATTLCEGQGSLFTADFHGDIPLTYEWSVSDGARISDINPMTHAFDTSGVFTVKITTHYQYCPDTNYQEVLTVNPFPGINIGNDTSLCPNSSAVTLRNFADFGNYPGATYLWSTGATSPSILVSKDGVYSATINYNGCTSTDSMTIYKDCYLDIPNGFTPNGDGINDYFLPRQTLGRSIVAYKMQIYSRWGQLIFETSAIDGRGWDGKFNNAVQPQGVYVYVIDVQYRDGRKEHYTDNVTLLK